MEVQFIHEMLLLLKLLIICSVTENLLQFFKQRRKKTNASREGYVRAILKWC